MNPLQRVLIEKAGREYGFENVLLGDADTVVLGSARYAVKVSVHLHDDGFQLWLPKGLLARELERDYASAVNGGVAFIVANIEELSALMLRTAALAQSLPNQAAQDYEVRVQEALIIVSKNGTEVERMVRQRIGQDAFRRAMMDYWGGTCAVTGINVPQVLRASHAKPWAECISDAERLDVFNGFLLSANLDALFDKFLISFDTDGNILISNLLNHFQIEFLGITDNLRVRWLAKQHGPYLQYHRDCFFGNQSS